MRAFAPIILTLLLSPALASASGPPVATAPTGPSALDALRAQDSALRDLVRAKAPVAKRQAAVDDLIDYHWLAQASLGGESRAPTVCKNRCEEFEALLTALVRRNYLRLMDDVVDYPVRFLGQEAGRNGMFKVSTQTSATKNGRTQTMTIDYVMHAEGGRFTVRDIITDGVSLVRTYRQEFRTMAREGGIDRIMTTLQDKLGRSN